MKSGMIIGGLLIILILIGGGLWFVLLGDSSSENPQKGLMDSLQAVQKKINDDKHHAGGEGIESKGVTSNGGEKTKPGVTSSGGGQISQGMTGNGQYVFDDAQTSNGVSVELPVETKEPSKKIMKNGEVHLRLLLLSLIDRKAVANRSFEIQYAFQGEKVAKEILESDDNGQVELVFTQTGFLHISLRLEGYAVAVKTLMIRFGENKDEFFFYKGGNFTVKAVDEENKLIKDLQLFLETEGDRRGGRRRFFGQGQLQPFPIVFNEKEGHYLVKDLPVGPNQFVFKAPGYLDSTKYKINISETEVSHLDIRLDSTRIVYFKLLGVATPPKEILVSSRVQTGFFRQARYQQTDGEPAFLLNDGRYEYELEDRKINRLTILVDGFLPYQLNLTYDKDEFEVPLEKGFEGVIKVFNEKGLPIGDAKISYRLMDIEQDAFTDEKGIALLTNLSEKANLRLQVSHKKYSTIKTVWVFDVLGEKEKSFTLNESKGLFGKVRANEKIVAGVFMHLYEQGKGMPIDKQESDVEGGFYFGNLQNKVYVIKAFHPEYGVKTVSVNSDEMPEEGVLVDLQQEKSLSIVLKDESGKSMPDKNLTLRSSFDQFSVSVMTDAEGKYEFYNLVHGHYFITLDDEFYQLQQRRINIPAGEMELKVKLKDVKKLQFINPQGNPHVGMVKGSVEVFNNSIPFEVHIDGEIGYFFEVRDSRYLKNFYLVFEIDGYSYIRLGPFSDIHKIPKEQKIELKEGRTFFASVNDLTKATPIPYAPIRVLSGSSQVLGTNTDVNGNANLTQLGDEFSIKVELPGFAPFEEEYKYPKSRDLVVNLIRGGTLKGYYPMSDEIVEARIHLNSVDLKPSHNDSVIIGSDGKFSFVQLAPGKYEMKLSLTKKSGRNTNDKIPVDVIIENEKEFEVSLEAFKENTTRIEVNIWQQGQASNQRSSIQIVDMGNKTVSNGVVIDGKFTAENVLPGEYSLRYNYGGKQLVKKIIIELHQNNVFDLHLPESYIAFNPIDERGAFVKDMMVTLFAGEDFRQLDSYVGNPLVIKQNLKPFAIIPKMPYYALIEDDVRYNYEIKVIGPFILEPGQSMTKDVVMTTGRVIPNLKIVDENGNPITKAPFFIKNKQGQIIQKTLKPEWHLRPYSEDSGFLPKNSWPNDDFTLYVSKDGFGFKEILIPANFATEETFLITLEKSSSISCRFQTPLNIPIGLGVLDDKGVLIKKPIPLEERAKGLFGTYFINVTAGTSTFKNLPAGSYYVGFFLNGSEQLLMKQGPYQLNKGDQITVNSIFNIPGF